MFGALKISSKSRSRFAGFGLPNYGGVDASAYSRLGPGFLKLPEVGALEPPTLLGKALVGLSCDAVDRNLEPERQSEKSQSLRDFQV
jgi:hypothetical protein